MPKESGTELNAFNWSLVVASNSEQVLNNNLLHGGESETAQKLLLKSPRSAASAYNSGLSKSLNDLNVFAHQDVFLPPGWAKSLNEQIVRLTQTDPKWGVAGLFGLKVSGESAGFVYSTGLQMFVGEPFRQPVEVRTLDELLIVVNKTSGLHFDENLPGFHLYASDICLEAEARGMKNYVIPCFVLHNSVGVKWLPWSFWRAYLYLRKKWADRLPVATPCTKITKGCAPVLEYFLTSFWASVKGKKKAGNRMPHADRFYKEQLLPGIERLKFKT